MEPCQERLARKHQALPRQDLSKSIYLFEPCKPVMVTTLDPEGGVNVAPFSWVVPCSNIPPKVCVCLLASPEPQRTLVNVRREREFVVNVVGLDSAQVLLESAKKVYPEGGKATYLGLKCARSSLLRTPRLAVARASLECRVSDVFKTGDHEMVVGDVVSASYVPGSFTRFLTVKLERWTPCLHLRHFAASGRDVHLFAEVSGSVLYEVPAEKGSE